MSDLETQIDEMAATIARRVKLRVQAEFAGLNLFGDTSEPASKSKRKGGRKPGPAKSKARLIDDLDEVDQKILEILAKEPISVEDLAKKKLKLTLSTVHRRVAKFKSEGRLKLVKEGNRSLYTTAPRRGPRPKRGGKKVRAKSPRAKGTS